MMQSAFCFTSVPLGALHISESAPRPAVVRPAEVRRHFYRCADCLSVVAINGTPLTTKREWPYPVDAECGACGGAIEYMGQVARDRLVTYDQLCACDERCQSARGPVCDCKCGGQYHGQHVSVTVRRDEGAVPVVQVPPGAREKAREYRELSARVKGAIEARYGRLFEAKRRGEWIENWSAYMDGSNLMRAWHAARELRTHSSRNRKLTAILKAVAE